MKKLLIITGIALFAFAASSFAKDPGLFSYDKSLVNSEMASLNEVENYLLNHPGVTLNNMLQEGVPLAEMINEPNSFTAMNLVPEKAMGIGGFWWGCCLGPVGVVVVYLVSEDKDETRSSIIGCVVSGVLMGGWVLLDELYFHWGWGPWYW